MTIARLPASPRVRGRQAIPGVSQKVLIRQLRQTEGDRIVRRVVYLG